MAYPPLDDVDRRLIGALQVDGRASPEQLADALDLPVRTVARLLATLLRDGTVRVTAVPPRDPGQRTSVVRVTVRRGKADAIAAALAGRPDVPFVDIASTSEEIGAFVVAGDGARSRLLSDLAGQFAVHGVLATTGIANLHIAVWLRDLDALYEFLTADLAGLGVSAAETILVGRVIKRPGLPGGQAGG